MEKNLIKKFRNRRKMKSLGKTKKVGRRGDRLVAKTNRTLKRYMRGGFMGKRVNSENNKDIKAVNDKEKTAVQESTTKGILKSDNRKNIVSQSRNFNRNDEEKKAVQESTTKGKLQSDSRQNIVQVNPPAITDPKSDYAKNRDTNFYTYAQDSNPLSREIGQGTRNVSKLFKQATNAIGLTSKFNDGQYNKKVLAIDPTLEKTLKKQISVYAYQYRDLLIRKYENNKNARNDLKARSDNFKKFKIWLLKRRGNFEYQHMFDDVSYYDTIKELETFSEVNNDEIEKKKQNIDDFRLRNLNIGYISKQEQELTILQRDRDRINKEKKELTTSREKYIKECNSIDQDIKDFQSKFVKWANDLSKDQYSDEKIKEKTGSKLVFTLQILSSSKTLLEYNNAPSSFFSKRLYPIWLDSMDVLRKIVFSTFTKIEKNGVALTGTDSDAPTVTPPSDDSSSIIGAILSVPTVTPPSDDSSSIIGAILAAISSEPIDGLIGEDEEEEEDAQAGGVAAARAKALDNGLGAYFGGKVTCSIEPISIPVQKPGNFSRSDETKRYLVIYEEENNGTFLGITEKIVSGTVTVKVIARVEIMNTQYIEQNDYSMEKNGILSEYKDPSANPIATRCKITEMVTLLENRPITLDKILYFIDLKPVDDVSLVKSEAKKPDLKYDNNNTIIQRWFEMIEKVYASPSTVNKKDIETLYIDTNQKMKLSLDIPGNTLTGDNLLIKLQNDFITVIKGKGKDTEECDEKAPNINKPIPKSDPAAKEYQINVDFFKRQFVKLNKDETNKDETNKDASPVYVQVPEDEPFYYVRSKMIKKGKKYRGRSAFFAHMLDDFKTAEMSLWFMRHPDHKEEVTAKRETVNVVSEDQEAAIKVQNNNEIKKIEEKYRLQQESLDNKREQDMRAI